MQKLKQMVVMRESHERDEGSMGFHDYVTVKEDFNKFVDRVTEACETVNGKLKRMFSQTNIIMKERRKIGMLGKTAKGKQAEDKETEYASYEICRKSKVGEYIQAGQEFFVADMKKKKIYSSNDLRLRELSEKVDSEDTFVFKEATYM